MTRLAHTARQRFGQVSSTIANASRHFVPQKLPSWKLALYLIVFLLPGGSFVVLALGWYENRHRHATAAAKSKQASSKSSSQQPQLSPQSSLPMLPASCACPGGGGASGRNLP